MKGQITSTLAQNNPRISPDTGQRRFSKRYTRSNLAVMVVLFFIAVAPTQAQAVPGFLEGALTDVDVAGRTARVNGVLINIPLGVCRT